MLVKSMIAIKLARLILSGTIGFAVLAWVVNEVTESRATVVVHVTEPDVEVRIDREIYQVVGRSYQPIECKLAAGDHRMVMSREANVLLDFQFRVERGFDLVLTASVPH
jgi:hypothetical protein